MGTTLQTVLLNKPVFFLKVNIFFKNGVYFNLLCCINSNFWNSITPTKTKLSRSCRMYNRLNVTIEADGTVKVKHLTPVYRYVDSVKFSFKQDQNLCKIK